MATDLKYFADAIRCDFITEFMEEWKKDSDFNSDAPEYDMLMDAYDGYDKQTYIQSLSKTQFIFYEGWSSLCWNGLYNKPEYKGLSKIECLNKFFVDRVPLIAQECSLKVIKCEYEFHESWDDSIEDGYIMLITFELV